MSKRCTDPEHERGDYGSCITCNQIAWARNHPDPFSSPADAPSAGEREPDVGSLAKAGFNQGAYAASGTSYDDLHDDIKAVWHRMIAAILADLTRQGFVVVAAEDASTLQRFADCALRSRTFSGSDIRGAIDRVDAALTVAQRGD